MMKKLVIYFLSALLILLGGAFVNIVYFWGDVIQVQDVTNQQVITLKSRDQYPSTIRFKVMGTLDGKAQLLWNCTGEFSTNCGETQTIGPGNIKFETSNDWYDKEFSLRYQPVDGIQKGDLKIRSAL